MNCGSGIEAIDHSHLEKPRATGAERRSWRKAQTRLLAESMPSMTAAPAQIATPQTKRLRNPTPAQSAEESRKVKVPHSAKFSSEQGRQTTALRQPLRQ